MSETRAAVPYAPTTSDDWLPDRALTFPDGFLWGTSCAAHQVEGGNCNNDWWAWEHAPDSVCAESSGDATDYWNRYEEDLDLCAAAGGQNLHRFSVEWSRIEPADGEWSPVALDHYRRLCDACLERGLAPMVTFHHFTTPSWATADGTWADDAIVDRFTRFVEHTASALGPDRLPHACTINEPGIVATLGYFLGMFPPGVRDADSQARATANLIRAHVRGVEAIKAAAPHARVGLALSMGDLLPADPDSESCVQFVDFVSLRMQDVFIRALGTGDVTGLAPAVDDFSVHSPAGRGDFVGCQYYSRMLLDPQAPGFQAPEPAGSEITQMGYAAWPPGLRKVLGRVADAGLPVVITENGMCTTDDRRRCAWIAAHLNAAHQALTEDRIDVRGYVYWSTTDNFEWALGYAPTFGLIGIGREHGFARLPRPSLALLGEIARSNRLDPDTVRWHISGSP